MIFKIFWWLKELILVYILLLLFKMYVLIFVDSTKLSIIPKEWISIRSKEE